MPSSLTNHMRVILPSILLKKLKHEMTFTRLYNTVNLWIQESRKLHLTIALASNLIFTCYTGELFEFVNIIVEIKKEIF